MFNIYGEIYIWTKSLVELIPYALKDLVKASSWSILQIVYNLQRFTITTGLKNGKKNIWGSEPKSINFQFQFSNPLMKSMWIAIYDEGSSVRNSLLIRNEEVWEQTGNKKKIEK